MHHRALQLLIFTEADWLKWEVTFRNHLITWVKMGHLEQVSQGHVQMVYEYPQVWRLHSVSV